MTSGNRPEVVTNPDPTVAVKDALELAIKNLSHEIDLRFDAVDKAAEVFTKILDDKLEAARLLVVQQSASNKEIVTQQATSNKELVNQARELTALALTAALQTQEKSAAETRTFIQESIRQLKSGVDEANRTTNEKIEVLRESVRTIGSRLDLAQGGFVNSNAARVDNRGGQMLIVSLIGAAIAAAAFFFGSGLHK